VNSNPLLAAMLTRFRRYVGDFAAACRAMPPLVEFTTKALGLKF